MNNGVKALVIAGVLAGILIALFIFTSEDKGPEPVVGGNDTPVEIVDNSTGPDVPAPTNPVPAPSEDLMQTGTVKDAEGRALVGATVTAYPIVDQSGTVAPDRARTTAADDSGAFSLTLRPGAYRIHARSTGYQEEKVQVAIAEGESPEPIDFTLTTGLTISGYVKNQGGQPVAGALVVAFIERVEKDATLEDQLRKLIEYQDIKGEKGIEGYSDENGWYSISGLEVRDYRLFATAGDYAPGELRHIAAGTSDANFGLLPGGVLTGTVQSLQGQPISNAQVEVYRNPLNKGIFEVVIENIMPALASRETDGNGRFEFDEIGGGDQYRVVVRADSFQGHQEDRVVINPGASVDLPITLLEGKVISGVVLGPDGSPVLGATVKANRQGGGAPKHQLESDDSRETDAAGNFIFDNLEDANYRVVATHPDYAADQRNRVQAGQDIELNLTVGGAVSGMITDSLTGAPIKGATVVVRDGAATEKTGVSDSNGGYLVRGIAIPKKGEAQISVEAELYARVAGEKVPVQEGLVTEGIDFSLDLNGSVAGFVQDSDGNPVSGVRITAKRQFDKNVPVIVAAGEIAVSGPNGEFRVEGVFPGEGEYLEGKHRDFLEGASKSFTLAPGEHLEGMLVIMERGGAISGVVVDEAGTPVPNARVAVKGQYRFNDDVESMDKKTMTDAAGSFALTNLEAGNHTILAVAPDFLRTERSGISVVESRTTSNVTLKLVKAAYVSGYVLDMQNNPIRGAKVECTDTSDGIRKLATTTDSNGYYFFDKLGPYEVDLSAGASGFGRSNISGQRVNQENVNLQLQRLGSVRGRVLDKDGEPLRAFSVSPRRLDPGSPVAAKTFQDPDGDFKYAGLDPGNYKIIVGAPGYAVRIFDSINVVPERTVDLGTIQLDQGGVVRGVVVDAVTGDPVAGAEVTVKEGLRAFQQAVPGVQQQPRRSNQRRDRRRTNSKGEFQFIGISNDSVSLMFTHREYMPWTEPGIMGGSEDVHIALERGGVIQGTVYAPDGGQKANTQVLLSGPGNDQRGVTDRKGGFSFSGLVTGTYTVTVTDFGTKQELLRDPKYRPEAIEGATQKRVDVIQGETRVVRIDLLER
ncbi:MAG: carboxypeptidase-like regulatory domain-containing protein [Planctomycetota bacterium]